MGDAAANHFLSVDVAGPPSTFPGALIKAVSEFGAAVWKPLAAGLGGEENQIQAPVAQLVRAAGTALGLRVTTHAEVSLHDLSVPPDFTVDLSGGRVGHIEVKAPSKTPTQQSRVSHARFQRQRQRPQPNGSS